MRSCRRTPKCSTLASFMIVTSTTICEWLLIVYIYTSSLIAIM